MARRLQIYETPEITVTFEPALCMHSTVCIRGLPAVFDVSRARWVAPEAASAERVAAQVDACPSRALKWYAPGELPEAVTAARAEMAARRLSNPPSS